MTLLRDVRIATARALGCRPREVAVWSERAGSLVLVGTGRRGGGFVALAAGTRERALRAALAWRVEQRARRAGG